MNLIKLTLKAVWVISLVTLIFFVVWNPNLPDPDQILERVKNIEPIQERIVAEQIIDRHEDLTYIIEPLYDYELYGLVVSSYDAESWFDFYHQKDPANKKDLCLVWGYNIESGAYRKVDYRSGEFTCYYQWHKPINPPFSGSYLSNNHLIPANEQVVEDLKQVDIGDQIYLAGYLSTYEIYEYGEKISSRGTSTSRDDAGNGACETIYLEQIEIIKKGTPWYHNFKKYCLDALIASSILGSIIFAVETKRGVV